MTKRNVLQVSDIGPPWSFCNPWIKIVVATVWEKVEMLPKNKITHEIYVLVRLITLKGYTGGIVHV